MQNTHSYCVRIVALAISSLFSLSSMAAENPEKMTEGISQNNTEVVGYKLGGSLTFGYESNIYDKDDHRSVRNLSWDLSLNSPINKQYKVYFVTGAYRALEDETGDFWNDSLIKLKRYSIYNFGESGTIDLSGQLTIPTSEASRDDDLQTALRIDLPVGFKVWEADISVSPRIRKNFHQYKTAGGRSLTEWIYSLSMTADYSRNKFSTGVSALAGNTVSYQGTRRDTFDYGASAYVEYQFTDVLSGSLSASTSGFYTDAERGNLGDLELFDSDKAIFGANISLSF